MYLKVSLRKRQKDQKLREKSFCKISFQVGMDLSKGQKQGKDEKIQEHYPTTERWRVPLWPPIQYTFIPSSVPTHKVN